MSWIVLRIRVCSFAYAPFCGNDDGDSAQPRAGGSAVCRSGCFRFARMLPQERQPSLHGRHANERRRNRDLCGCCEMPALPHRHTRSFSSQLYSGSLPAGRCNDLNRANSAASNRSTLPYFLCAHPAKARPSCHPPLTPTPHKFPVFLRSLIAMRGRLFCHYSKLHACVPSLSLSWSWLRVVRRTLPCSARSRASFMTHNIVR